MWVHVMLVESLSALIEANSSWSVHFISVPWPIRSSGGHEGGFRRDPLPVFSAGSPCEQFLHGQGCPLFGVVHPAFPLLTVASPTLQGALKEDGSGEAVMVCDLEGCWGTAGDFTTSLLHFSVLHFPLGVGELQACPFPDVVFHLFFYLPSLLPSFTMPWQMVLTRPDEWETCPHHFSLRLFVKRPMCGLIACWILAWTSSSGTWSLYEMCSILQ